ncbi:dihydrofolate reductase [Sphaerotilus sp.]|jgi:dihydrofolate reductase|uniref:dihydrofolate reductase n=1 Tax=Sphaerotilus sp. TaxID=2093942 RepID=UPI00286D91AA|nr:dihydrofolate reductase [Sphaerotilus sp.]
MAPLCLIAAVARNGVIGHGNGLVWHDPLDAKHFRTTTMGCPVIMGRKTWDSLPARFRPLPGRRNLVVTRQPHWADTAAARGAEAVSSLDAALAAVAGTTAPRVCVIGGGELYALALPHAKVLELTEIDADLDGDIRFPDWPRTAFEEVARTTHPGFAFVTYRRR